MKRFCASLLLLTPVLTASGSVAQAAQAPAKKATSPPLAAAPAYGAKVLFKRNVPLKFPDFELIYAEERRVAAKGAPRGLASHGFRVVKGNGAQMVSWSGGGKDNAVPFGVAGKVFQLELRESVKLGRLQDYELVITEVPGKKVPK